MGKAYIIIVNYNGWKDTIECLESVFKLEYNNFQVIVIDNCSLNGSFEKIKAWTLGNISVTVNNPALQSLSMPPIAKPLPFSEYTQAEAEANSSVIPDPNPLILIQAYQNGGFSHGNNIGLRFALTKKDFDYVWLLNNDTVTDSGALHHLTNRMNAYQQAGKKVGLIGGKVLYYDEPDVLQCVSGGTYNKWIAIPTPVGNNQKDNGQFDVEEVNTYLIMGACTLISRAFLEEVGLLGEDYFLYFEEQDLAERGRRKGNWQLGYAWQSKVYHKDGSSTGGSKDKTKTSKLSDYYYSRSKILFTKKFYSFCLPTVYLSFIPIMINRMRRGKMNHIPLLLKLLLNPSKKFTP